MIQPAKNLSRVRAANKMEAAEFFDIALPTLDSWIRRGAPVSQRGRRGVPWVLDLLDLAKWKFGAEDDDGAISPDEMTPKERLDHYRAERERTKHEEEVGLLVQTFDMEQTLAVVYKGITQAIETWPDRMEQEQGASPGEIERMQALGDRLRELLYEASNGG